MKALKLGKRIFVITAHPDDESYLAAGTLYLNAKAGGQNFLMCATLGEKGTSKLRRPKTLTQMKDLRKKELTAVSKFLQVSKLYQLNYPDGNVQDCCSGWLPQAVKAVKRHKPDLLLGFGPDGISGHRDHQAAHTIAKGVSKKLGLPLYMFTVPPRLRKNFYQWVKRRRALGKYHTKDIKHGKAEYKVDVGPKIKFKALSFHKSQLDPRSPYHGFS